MPTTKDKSPTSLPSCVSCACELGVEVKVLPFFVDDCATARGDDGAAKHEPFCPQCFVYVRSPREPERFMPGAFAAIKCGKCGLTSVAPGHVICGQCRSRNVVML